MEVALLGKINFIHKTDVYFNFFEPKVVKKALMPPLTNQMHHGDFYIYLNQIILHDNDRWFRASIKDIIDIKGIIPKKQIIIHFCNFDLVLFCKDISQLSAIRDFLKLSQNYFVEKNSGYPRAKTLIGNKFQRELQKIKNNDHKDDFSKISN